MLNHIMLNHIMLIRMTTFGSLVAIVNAQDGVELAMTIFRPQLVSLKETNVQLKCSLASFEKIPLSSNTCKFIMPSSKEITVNYNNGTATGARGIKGQVNHCRRICGIIIEIFEQEHIGQWSCIMNDKAPFQKGTFSLMTEGCVKDMKDVRLPYHIVPHNYELTIIPILDEGNFTALGKLDIQFTTANVIEEINRRRVVVHSSNILIKEDIVKVTDANGKPIANVSSHEYDFDRDFYVIHLDADLKPSTNYSLLVDFISKVNEQPRGLYHALYVENSKENVMGATHFEANHARKAFPCLDEPDRKATFVVKVGRKAEHVAFSNMPITSTENINDPPNYQMDTFQRSPIMSSYLLALVIGDFVRTSSPIDPSFSIINVKSKAAHAKYAVDFGLNIMKFFETYLDYKYPLPKMDIVALPIFRPGGMENWGLIICQDADLLVEEGVTSLVAKEYLELVIAHELAHQWFGNLVTMKWWNDIWLNEGFAPHMQVIGGHLIHPENELPDRLILDNMHVVFGDDALESSQPVSVNVDDPGNFGHYATLSYTKGTCLIRMAENFLTKDTFNKGIQSYLKSYAYSNVERANLWEHLDAAAKEDGILTANFGVHDIMEDWFTVTGYPVVNVIRVKQNQYTLVQERFFLNCTAKPVDTKWFIPITIATPGSGSQNNTFPSVWISAKQESINVEIKDTPFIIYVKQTGFYRVNYNNDNWLAIINILKSNYTSVEKLNRAQLMDDSFNLARASQISYDIPLALLEYLQSEDHFVPLQSGLDSIAYLDRMLRHNSKDYIYMQNYVKEVFLPAYIRLGFDGKGSDGYLTVLLRKNLISILCLYQLEDCNTKAGALFKSWMDSNDPDSSNPIQLNLKPEIYEIAIRNGGQEEFDFLLKRYQNTQLDSERTNVMSGLAASQRKELLTVLLGKTIDFASGLQAQDCSTVYQGIGATVVGRRVQFDWLKDNFNNFVEYFGFSFEYYATFIVNGILSDANTNEEIKEVLTFTSTHLPNLTQRVKEDGTLNTPESIDDIMEQWLSVMRSHALRDTEGKWNQHMLAPKPQAAINPFLNVQWMENNYEQVVTWLKQHTNIKPSTHPTHTTKPNTNGMAGSRFPLNVILLSMAALSIFLG